MHAGSPGPARTHLHNQEGGLDVALSQGVDHGAVVVRPALAVEHGALDGQDGLHGEGVVEAQVDDRHELQAHAALEPLGGGAVHALLPVDGAEHDGQDDRRGQPDLQASRT